MNRTATIFALLATLPLAAQTTPKKTTSTTRRTTTTRKTMQPMTPPEPGTQAIGDMPAATGKPETIFAFKYIDLKIGTGELAQPRKFYTVHYTGWTLDGKKFDSSYDHPGAEPFVFPVGAHRVIAGWDLGFEGMRVGGKRRLIVPYQLAYGEAGHPPVIPAKATLIFDIELLGQGDTPEPVGVAPKPTPAPDSKMTGQPATEPAK